MKRSLLTFLLLSLFPIILGGCLNEANQENDADHMVGIVHQGFKTGEWDAIMPLYDKSFLKLHPASVWKNKLLRLTKPLGALKNIKSTFLHKDPRFRGDFYIYGFLLQFEHGTISETLTMLKNVDQDKMTISGHQLRLKKHNS